MKRALASMLVFSMAANVFAQERELSRSPDSSRGGLTFRAASDVPLTGFDRQTVGSAEVYVSKKELFSARDLTSAEARERGASLQLGADAASRLASLSGEGKANRLVVFADGVPSFVGVIDGPITGQSVVLSGLSTDQVSRLLRATGRPDVATDLRLVPDQSIATAGNLILVDVFVRPVQNLRGYQVGLVVTGGDSGKLELKDVVIDEGRQAYVFTGIETLHAVDVKSNRMLNALPAGTVHLKDESYLATFVYQVSGDAKGTFHVSVNQAGETMFLDENGTQVLIDLNAATQITVR